ncbi:recombinase family protein [Rhodobacter sp. CZR27]|uniref:recombinase family protein n=1 Tax=Rhodobacter sp. CZR27 TaxID=2033869 RepID=UPI000BBEF131|nr:recombinase family protein [Rhodobacter sp. CZR27]
MRNAVGFYWTLPVPWQGFTALPREADAAARLSTTVRYQVQLIRRHAKTNDLKLVHEEVFMELAPDRGTRHVADGLKRVVPICREHRAVLLVVDFAQVQNWRGHAPLHDACANLGLELETVYPDEIDLDGQRFEPQTHFARWRERQRDWSDGKEARLTAAVARAAALREAGLSLSKTATQLNDEGLKSATGRAWTADGVRKLLAE